MYLYYDIMCKLDKHLSKHRSERRLPDLGFIPMLHAMAYGRHCQLMYGPKMVMGTGSF